ncbi:MAG: glycosyl hydrolase family protein, partial [Actinobacteria bacterium]|nr:glycosyl hydrolase family protein [Actinomycetota bacterium]
SVTVRWQPPMSDGGASITQYRLTAINGTSTRTATPAPSATAYTFTGLTNNVSYSFAVFARNSVGESASSQIVTMTPSTTAPKVPLAPTIGTVNTSVSRTLIVNYSLGSNNGSTITSVSYSIDAGLTWLPVTDNPLVIEELTNGRSYALRLRSSNLIGTSLVGAKSVKPVATKNTITFLTPQPMQYGQSEMMTIDQAGGSTLLTSLTPLICTVDGFTVSAIKPGTCSLKATNTGDVTYGVATSVTKAFTITKAPNSLDFQTLSDMAVGSPNQSLSSTVTGGTTTYTSITPTICSIVTGAVRALKVGNCTVRASNAGNVYYLPATSITQTISISAGSATSTPSPTPSPTPLSCTLDSAQLCGPISNVSVSVDGVNRTITSGALTVPVNRPVRIAYTSNSANAGKRVLITIDGLSGGITSSVPHSDWASPWSSSSCYPDGSNSQCQLMLDANGSGYFIATFASATVGGTFELRQKGPAYSSSALLVSFVSGSSNPSPTATATPSPSPTSTSGAPWTIRQTTFTNSEFSLNTGDANLWVSYGWYANGLRYGTVHLAPNSTKTVSFNVKDRLGNNASGKTVTLILGKGYSNSTAHVRVGSTSTSGWDPGTGVHQATVTGTTDASGNVSFAIVNTDATGTSLYTQISAYVANVSTDVVDIINIAYDLAPTPSATPMPSMSLLWQDDFSGTAGTGPNSSYWTADVQDGCNIGNCGWGNGEREWYTTAANQLNGLSNLVITANKLNSATAPDCYYGKCTWSSGKITSYGKVNFTYGYLEARIKNPSGGGSWPAFWMLGQDIATRPWPLCGEIDIMEGEGNAPYTNWGTAHWANTNQWDHIQGPGQNTTTLPVKLSDDYHTYGILWTATSLTWYIDGVARYTLNKSFAPNSLWPFGPKSDGTPPKFYAIFNVAMGGSMGG